MPLAFIGEGLLQPSHILFILIIVLLIFGPGKLPELGKGLGKGIKEFKDAIRGATEEPPQRDDKKVKAKKEEAKEEEEEEVRNN